MEGLSFYRCALCASVVSKWDITKGAGCPRCGGRKIAPSNLSFIEKCVQLIKHPAFWKWGHDLPKAVAEFPGDE